MRHLYVHALAAAAALAAHGCTNLNGLADYEVDPTLGPGGVPGGECTTNQQCIQTKGPLNVCRKPDGVCVPLVSEQCKAIIGDYENDAAVVFGTTGALSGANASTGTSMTKAAELAADNINAFGGLPPLPGTTQPRPVVLVECDDANNNDTALAVANHLAETLRVPAVIGSNSSGISQEIFTEVFFAHKTMEISPAATGTSLSRLNDEGLFWRTIPSLTVNVDALVKVLPELETYVKAKVLPAPYTGPISVGVIVKDDNFGLSSYGSTVENGNFKFNSLAATAPENEPYFEVFNYGNPNASDTAFDYSDTVTRVIQLKPHIIFMYGANEIISAVMPQIEAGWPADAGYKPFYLFHANGFKVELWDQITALDPAGVDLRKRVLGTNPTSVGEDLNRFRTDFLSKFPSVDNASPDSLGAMNAYDAMYVLAMATVAAGADVTGPGIAAGMSKLSAGQEIKIGNSDDMFTGFELLGAGQTVNLRGLTGPLDFDAQGDVISDVYFYCVGLDGQGAPAKVGGYPGIKFDPGTSQLVSTAGASATLPDLLGACGF